MNTNKQIEDGGAAFPDALGYWGMSLRDYFAAKALQGMLSNNEMCPNSLGAMASEAFKIADCMIAARKGGV